MKTKHKISAYIMTSFKVIFKIAEKVVPSVAQKWAIKMFFSPLKYPYPEREVIALASAHTHQLKVNGKMIQVYEWGKGPSLLFVHGWAGRGTQAVEFIKPLVEAGYNVISFDAPAHGKSEGKQTHIVEFQQTIEVIETHVGKLHVAIGHSLGATSLLFARSKGLSVDKLILVSTPALAETIIIQFLKNIGGSPKIGEYVRNYIFNKFNKKFEEFSAMHIVSNSFPNTDLFLIHDENDPEAPISDFHLLKNKVEPTGFYVTKSLGHTRILRDKKVVEKIVDFVKGTTDDKNIRTTKQERLLK